MGLSLILLSIVPLRLGKVNRGGTQQFVPLALFLRRGGPSVPHREGESEGGAEGAT